MEKVFVDGEFVCLKKSKIFGWGVIHPIKNDDGSMNWFNFVTGGSWSNFFMWLLIAIIIVGVLYEYSININALTSCFDNVQTLENCKQIFGNNNLLFTP